MMVVWAEPAVRRLEEIRDYEQAGDAVADAIVEALVELGESLDRFPERGRRLAERPRSRLRELVHRGRYRLVYRVKDDEVQILTVFERHRQLADSDLPAERPPLTPKRRRQGVR
jgi:toxin ParE1/3/4